MPKSKGRKNASRKGTKVRLGNVTPQQRLEMQRFLGHIQEYDLHQGFTLYVDLYTTYVHDFAEFYPELYSNMGPRTFSLRMQHVLGLKMEKRVVKEERRGVAGNRLKGQVTTFYDVPLAIESEIPSAESVRIAA